MKSNRIQIALLLLPFAAALPSRAAVPSRNLETLSQSAGASWDGSVIRVAAPVPGAPAHSGVKLPPNPNAPIITLSQLADQISSDPASIEKLVAAVRGRLGQIGQGFPGLDALDALDKERLIRAIRTVDKKVLDRFPTMNVARLADFIKVYGERKGSEPAEPPFPPTHVLKQSGQPREAADGEFLKDLGNGFYHGDLTQHGRRDAYGDDIEISDEFNRLSLNEAGKPPLHTLVYNEQSYAAIGEFLAALLKDGHAIEAKDMRMFANFGGLWFQQNGQWISVATPLFVDTGINLPSGKRLSLPVTHTHLEIDIRGPKVNANVMFYLGLGGSARWYPNATLDKPWVGAKSAQEWHGAAAVRLAERAAISRRDVLAKVKKHGLPIGGYGALGSCGDVHAFITGKAVYPLLRDPEYFGDGMQIDEWSRQFPFDVDVPATPQRIWESLPSQEESDIKVPQIRELFREFKAWKDSGFRE